MSGYQNLQCAHCKIQKTPLEKLVIPYEYGGQLAEAIKKLKFQKRTDTARALGPILRPSFQSAAQDCDVVTAVPLHWRRLATRGFNQSERLQVHLCSGLHLKTAHRALRRVKATSPQSNLRAQRRMANVEGAFKAAPRLFEHKRVLLVDDILTTGATLRSAATALKKAGAASITGFCVARVFI